MNEDTNKDEIVIPISPDLKEANKKDYKRFVKDEKIIGELKHDGTFVILIVRPKDKNNKVTLMGRGILKDGSQSNYTSKFPEIVRPWQKWNYDSVFIGELEIRPEGSRFESFNTLQSRTTRIENIDEYATKYPARLVLHDVAYFMKKNHMNLPFKERRQILENIDSNIHFPDKTFLIKQKKTRLGKKKLWKFVKKHKLEGMVFKDLDAPFGEKMHKWKLHHTEDVYITEGYRGTGRLKEMDVFGALRMMQYVNDKPIWVGNLGSGFKDEDRKLIQSTYLGNLQADDTYPIKDPLVIEILFDAVTKDDKFRHPRANRKDEKIVIRTDKSPKQCIRKYRIL